MNTIIGIFSLITALLTVAYFADHPIDWSALKAHLSHFNHWPINEDGEHLTAYGIICFALVVFVVWGISLL